MAIETPEAPAQVRPRRDLVRSVTLFQNLPSAAIDRLVTAFERHHFSDGEVIFRQGDGGDNMYLVENGQVDIFRIDPERNVRRLARVGAGGYFGELALLSDKPRAATCQAVGETDLLSLSARELQRLLAESGPALRAMIGAVGEYKPPDPPPPLRKRLGIWFSEVRSGKRGAPQKVFMRLAIAVLAGLVIGLFAMIGPRVLEELFLPPAPAPAVATPPRLSNDLVTRAETILNTPVPTANRVTPGPGPGR